MKIGQKKKFRHICIELCESDENPGWIYWDVSAIENKKLNKELEECSGYIEVDEDEGPTFLSYGEEEYCCNSVFHMSSVHNSKSMSVLKEFIEDIEDAMKFCSDVEVEI